MLIYDRTVPRMSKTILSMQCKKAYLCLDKRSDQDGYLIVIVMINGIIKKYEIKEKHNI